MKTYDDERQPAAVKASDLCKLLQAKGSLPKSAHLAIESEPQREQRQSGLCGAAGAFYSSQDEREESWTG